MQNNKNDIQINQVEAFLRIERLDLATNSLVESFYKVLPERKRGVIKIAEKSPTISENLENILKKALEELCYTIERSVRIISVGEKWEFEEIMFVVQSRIEIEMVLNLLTTYSVEVKHKQKSIFKIDSWLGSLSSSRNHSKVFVEVIKAIENHSEIIEGILLIPQKSNEKG